jgi:hypothetical protein
MKNILVLTACVFSTLYAESNSQPTFSTSRLTGFYEEFLCQEKDELSLVGINTPCSLNPFNPHPNPPAPTFKTGYLPFVLVNRSGFPDNQIYVLVTGKQEGTSPELQSFMRISSDGTGTLITATPGDNATNYSYLLSDLPADSSGHVFYMPKGTDSGVVWFSIKNKLNMPVNAPNNIVQPNFTSPADPNYYTNFDIFEMTYISTGTNISGDATAVSFFSIPLYGYISTPAPGTPFNTGLFESRNSIISTVENVFTTAIPPAQAQWNNLILRNGSTVLRVLSTQHGIATASSLFDANYLDNAATYGYSYINDIWSSLTSFYRMHPLTLTIPNGSLETYTGVINGGNTITFTSSPSGYVVVLAAPTTTTPTTTFDIFAGQFFIVSDNSPGAADGIQLNKLFEESIIAGLVPTANTLSNPYLVANQGNFYTVNPNLSPAGKSSGPWYDLYSKALHSVGTIYTYSYDEPLWPQVQISSNTPMPRRTIVII